MKSGERAQRLERGPNRLDTAHSTAVAQLQSRRNALTLHLQIATPRSEDLLEAVNKRRKILDLPGIEELTADTKLDNGLAGTASAAGFNKESALRDVKAVTDAENGFSELAKIESAAIISDLARLEADPGLLAALQSRAFVERGLQLATSATCPLCDLEWPSDRVPPSLYTGITTWGLSDRFLAFEGEGTT
jgi:hypothetical protein